MHFKEIMYKCGSGYSIECLWRVLGGVGTNLLQDRGEQVPQGLKDVLGLEVDMIWVAQTVADCVTDFVSLAESS